MTARYWLTVIAEAAALLFLAAMFAALVVLAVR